MKQHRVRLGRTGLQVSPICYGSWQLSPRFWGVQPEEVFIDAMRRAFELGVNFYDTADAYGNGLAEEVMGKALAPLPREELVVTTKVFWHFFDDGRRYGDLSKAYIIQACENSLRRLNMTYVDLYQIHSYDPLAEPTEIVEALEKLIKDGKIRAFGTSNWTVEQMRLGNQLGNYGTCQPPYSLLRRGIESDILPYCQANDIGTLVYSPLHRGLLSGKYKGTESFTDLRQNDVDFTGERFEIICDRMAQVGKIGHGYGLSPSQTILAATLMHPGIHCAIVGVKRPEHIEEAVGAMSKSLSREDWNSIRTLLTV